MPRRPLFGVPATRTIRVRVTDEQLRELETVARENGVEVSGLIRDAVNTLVADYREGQVFRRTVSKPAATV